MRHYFLSRPVAALPRGVLPAAARALLVALAGRGDGLPPGSRGAAVVAVNLASVAAAADDHLIAATRAQEQAAGCGLGPRSSQTRCGRTPSSAGYSSCIRARHGVGHGVEAKLPGNGRRRACPQFWQALRPPSSPIRGSPPPHRTPGHLRPSSVTPTGRSVHPPRKASGKVERHLCARSRRQRQLLHLRVRQGAPGAAEGRFRARGAWSAGLPRSGYLHVGTRWISQVSWRSIPYLCPVLRPRPDRQDLATFGPVDAAPGPNTPKHRENMISRLNFGLRYPLPTLHEWRCRRPCKARFRLAGCAFAGRESDPLERVERFQVIAILLSRILLTQVGSTPSA